MTLSHFAATTIITNTTLLSVPSLHPHPTLPPASPSVLDEAGMHREEWLLDDKVICHHHYQHRYIHLHLSFSRLTNPFVKSRNGNVTGIGASSLTATPAAIQPVRHLIRTTATTIAIPTFVFFFFPFPPRTEVALVPR